MLSLLRVLPGQRYVGAGVWRGTPVLAKLLVGGNAARHFQRELQGARLLAEQGLNTPQLLADGQQDGGGWLLFDYLDGAQSLAAAWAEQGVGDELNAPRQALLASALGVIGQLHGRGLWQADLHLDNLLQRDGQLFLIDGGGVHGQVPGQPLSQDKVLENLGVLFAQLPPMGEEPLEEVLIHYLLANSAHGLPLEALLKEVAKVRRWRLRDYLKKIGRDCSLFSAKIGAFGLRVVRRDREAELQPLLAAPEAFIASGHRFKGGGAATVARAVTAIAVIPVAAPTAIAMTVALPVVLAFILVFVGLAVAFSTALAGPFRLFGLRRQSQTQHRQHHQQRRNGFHGFLQQTGRHGNGPLCHRRKAV